MPAVWKERLPHETNRNPSYCGCLYDCAERIRRRHRCCFGGSKSEAVFNKFLCCAVPLLGPEPGPQVIGMEGTATAIPADCNRENGNRLNCVVLYYCQDDLAPTCWADEMPPILLRMDILMDHEGC